MLERVAFWPESGHTAKCFAHPQFLQFPELEKLLRTTPARDFNSLLPMAIVAIPMDECVQPTTASVPRMDTCFIPTSKVRGPIVQAVDTLGVFVLPTTH